MRKSVWILTTEYNAYDQYGEYFVAVFFHKPSLEELEKYDVDCPEHVLNTGGGRIKLEDQWWYLVEHKAEGTSDDS